MVKIEILFILDLFFLSLTIFKVKSTDINYSMQIKSFFLLLIFGIYLTISPLIFNKTVSKNFFKIIWTKDYISNLGIINYHAIDAYNYFSSKIKRSVITQEDIDLIKDWHKNKSLKINGNDFTGIAKGANLIIIQVESLQNFVINKKLNNREITPNLNRLAREGIYFKNIYDQTASGNTSDSTFIINSSLFPLSKGAVSFLYPENCYDSIAKILKSGGYTTAVMHALDKNYWNMSKFDKALGFQNQFYEDSYEMTEKLGGMIIGLSDREFFRQSIVPLPVLLQQKSSLFYLISKLQFIWQHYSTF
jgi:phosphoglycerol transferase MdoB-like AlkP superfamily enzyme